jgi:hypothetical protein
LRLVRELRERGILVRVVMMSGYVAESARVRRLGTVIQEALSG